MRKNYAACCVLQGVWTHWENVIPFDFSWTNLIYGPGPRVIAFILNAQINSVRTPDMLKLWGYIDNARCKLCSNSQGTLHHILVGCKHSLDQGRYTWRHDSVLSHIESALLHLIAVFNKRKPVNAVEAAKKSFKTCFVRKDEKPQARAKQETHAVLSKANDWKIVVDFEDRKWFSPRRSTARACALMS